MALQPWVKRALIHAGRMDENGLTRRARIRRCRCGIPCLAGLDAPVAALSVWCDLTEVTAFGEAMGLLEDRRSYELWNDEIRRRDQWSITGHPAGRAGSQPVLLSHVCGSPVPAAWEHHPPEVDEPEVPVQGWPPF